MADFTQVATNEDIAAIADAIRYAEGSEADMTIPEMPAKIRALRKLLVEKTITQNGEYLPASDAADGYSKVTVSVGGLPPVEEITNLAGTKWRLKETLSIQYLGEVRLAGAIESGNNFDQFGCMYIGNSRLQVGYVFYSNGFVVQTRTIYEGGYLVTGREIVIAGGNDQSKSAVVSWFKDNATLIGYMPQQ